MTLAEKLTTAREAVAAREWARAYDALRAADRDGELGADDLERLALAAYLSGHDEAHEDAMERLVHRLDEAGEARRAARSAFWLALALLLRGEPARGGGWLARAQRTLAEAGNPPCPEQGLLMAAMALHHLGVGESEVASDVFDQVVAIGRRFRDPDVTAFGFCGRGQAMIAGGRRDTGLRLLDEAMVAVTADDVSPVTVGIVYCAVVVTCHQAFDLHRAREWTGVLSRWCAAQPELVPYRGQCLVHRAQVLAMEGRWPEAMEEMARARQRLADPPGQPAVGMAWYETGELLRRLGRHPDAEDCYRRASQHGHSPQPGMLLLRLAQGRGAEARSAVDAVLATATTAADRWALLVAAIEVCCATGDAAAARAAADELEALAREQPGEWLGAIATTAAGTVLLAEGAPREAGAVLARARDAWHELRVPYEAARVRILLGEVWSALGDADGALLEWDAARYTFEQLGAVDDLARVAARLAPEATERPSGLTDRELEVLRLVAQGQTNREIAATLVLSEHTVRRHLQNVFARLGVSSRAAAVAFAVQHDLV
ncbi:LuxR family transcriptional regulator [Geodermatophilus marinus]|uniref:LuxR family transcriptional regulator n=1 Tax=Geodermatophilus sp. LHW52908 TaxID=2303986 RepID=UPI000E3D7E5B|nr:LuxR family transcriptional regulator [Geodermatophilus sp. LHW52908]RFU20853.1 LuxR family transcriptional regulator [Geodermatophilus sp. LHW52908]